MTKFTSGLSKDPLPYVSAQGRHKTATSGLNAQNRDRRYRPRTEYAIGMDPKPFRITRTWAPNTGLTGLTGLADTLVYTRYRYVSRAVARAAGWSDRVIVLRPQPQFRTADETLTLFRIFCIQFGIAPVDAAAKWLPIIPDNGVHENAIKVLTRLVALGE